MKTTRVCETVLAGMLALAVAYPLVFGAPPAKTATPVPPAPIKAVAPAKAAIPAPSPAVKPALPAKLPTAVPPMPTVKPAGPAAVVDAKSLEGQLLSAQGQIVAGNLDAGLKALKDVRTKAAPASAARVNFVQKLVEIHVADKLGDAPKVLAGLTDAIKQATQPDQVAACWQLGLNLAQAAVAAKSPSAAGLIDLLSTQPAAALRQFEPRLQLARLQMTTGHPAAAEAELAKAASRVGSPADCAAWTAAVADLAKLVDAGQAPQAGADLFERLRKSATALPVQVALDVTEARALLARGELIACQDVLDRAIVAAKTVKPQAPAVLSLSYDLAAAFQKTGAVKSSAPALAKAEAMAETLPPSAELTAVRCGGLVSNGGAASAAELAWKAASAAKNAAEREQMLLLYANAAVAAGQDTGILANLQAMKAPAVIYTAAADALTKAGNTQAALAVVEAVPAAAVVADAKAAAEVTSVMQRIHKQHQQTAGKQAARCRAIAAEYAVAAKKADSAKQAPQAAAHVKQAAAFENLAKELER